MKYFTTLLLLLTTFYSKSQNYNIFDADNIYHYKYIQGNTSSLPSFYKVEEFKTSSGDSIIINPFYTENENASLSFSFYHNKYAFFSSIVFDGTYWKLNGMNTINIPDEMNKKRWQINADDTATIWVEKREFTSQYGISDSIIYLKSHNLEITLSKTFGILHFKNDKGEMNQVGIQGSVGYQKLDWKDVIPYKKGDYMFFDYDHVERKSHHGYLKKVVVNKVIHSSSSIKLYLKYYNSKYEDYLSGIKEEHNASTWNDTIVYDSLAIIQHLYSCGPTLKSNTLPNIFNFTGINLSSSISIPIYKSNELVGFQFINTEIEDHKDTISPNVKGMPTEHNCFFNKDNGNYLIKYWKATSDADGIENDDYQLIGGAVNGISFGDQIKADTFWSLSVANHESTESISVFPNPSNDKVFISVNKNQEIQNPMNIEILEIATGRVLKTYNTVDLNQAQLFEIDTKAIGLSAGLYAIIINNGTSKSTQLLTILN